MESTSSLYDSKLSLKDSEELTKLSPATLLRDIYTYIGYSILFIAHVLICDFRLFSVIIMALYLIFGALLFTLIEVKENVHSFAKLNKSRYALMGDIQRAINISDDVMSNISERLLALLNDFDDFLLSEPSQEIDDDGKPWPFSDSLSFCFVVVTTIGYSELVPKTDVGKVVTIIYATIGIPLCLNTYFRLAGVLIKAVDNCIRKVKSRFQATKEVLETDRDSIVYSMRNEKLTFLLSLFASLAYLIVGSFMVYKIENFPFLDAFYFMFTTLVTIGFADVDIESKYLMNIFIPFFFLGYTLLVMVATSSKLIFHNEVGKVMTFLMTKFRRNRIAAIPDIPLIETHYNG